MVPQLPAVELAVARLRVLGVLTRYRTPSSAWRGPSSAHICRWTFGASVETLTSAQ